MSLYASISRAAVPVLACAALAAGCGKQDASAPDVAGKSADAVQQAVQQGAQEAAQRAAQRAAQQLDQAASFVNRQVDAATSQTAGANASAADLASSARGQLRDAASAGQAMLGHAAAATGTGLQIAGRSLQQWASGVAASAPAATGTAKPASDAGD